MTKLNEVYKCEVCGNVVEVLHTGVGELVCCNKPMELMEAHSEDTGYEKHVPVFEKEGDEVKVKVGSVPHPMEKEHYIEWIEVIADGEVHRKHLKPGDKPEAEFEIRATDIIVREFCNLHGLWKTS